ncbi:MAG TPA: DUF1003 domain-containing protein [Candidatus Saccharimonadia bacterium]
MDLEKPPHEERMQHRRRAIKSYRAKADKKRNLSARFADWLTSEFGTVTFLALNAIWFAVWIAINTGLIQGIKPFDPFPFGLLTMIVSLEAIFLAIIVLISQNRASKIAEIREEVDLQVNSITEGEVTKVIQLLMLLLEKNGINVKDDSELYEMLRPVRSADLERILEKQLS